ncbi:hypothetical protein LCGC14_1685810 [marine sediment metagenome]|uniref:Uncharacterized protein n=1 Tax=marine sediment metagenome TaxID=412755 RepID=A0A0F9HMB1_9ZZZZ
MIVIISLLVTILMPTVGRVRDMARKTVCSTTLHSHGVAVASYVSANDAYPNVAPWPWWGGDPLRYANGDFDDGLNGWPKFYGLLETMNIKGTRRTNWGNWYYGGAIENIWKGSFCPSMDPMSILAAANNAGNYGYNGNWLYWVWFHKWAIGYQWSPFLRSATRRGRVPVYLKLGDDWDDYLYQWIMPYLRVSGEYYYTQGAHPRELKAPGRTAEAWDSWDIESTPNIRWLTQHTSYGAFTPGWHGGAARINNKMLFNGWRHQSCPNILYADGHIASDANVRVDPVAEGMRNEFVGMHAYTWDHSNGAFGNMDYLIPRTEFAPEP